MTARVPLQLRKFGSGARGALALHCTLSHAGAWRGLGAVLDDQYTLNAFDLPGHGGNPISGADTDAHALATEWAIEALNAPMDLIGHSYGATVALSVALEQPHLVRSLTLIEPVLFAAARAHEPAVLETHLDQAAPYLSALAAGDMARAARLFNRVWGDGRPWADFPQRTRQYMIDRMQMVVAHDEVLVDDRLQMLAPGRLECLQMPVLLLEGTRSPQIIGTIQAALAARLQTVRRARIDGAGHMVPITHPEAVGRAMRTLSEMA